MNIDMDSESAESEDKISNTNQQGNVDTFNQIVCYYQEQQLVYIAQSSGTTEKPISHEYD